MPKSVRPKEIKVRFSLAEHERALQLAGNKPLAVYLRNLAVGEQPLDLEPSETVPKVDPALLYQIAVIGNNLNQIARAMNTVTLSAGEKILHLSTLNQIKNEIDKLAGQIPQPR